MRLKDRVAIVVGAGQSPGEGMGNGRATALTFAPTAPADEGAAAVQAYFTTGRSVRLRYDTAP